jgi:putative glycosyltransferase (TIGR04372 family)
LNFRIKLFSQVRDSVKRVLGFTLTVALLPIALFRLVGISVRFGKIPCKRYGHLAKNSDLFLRRISAGLIDDDWIVICVLPKGDKEVANHALLELVLRECAKYDRIFVCRSRLLYRNWSWIEEVLQRAGAHIDLGYNSSEVEFSTLPQAIFIPESTRTESQKFLSDMGINVTKPIVGVFVRDSEYLRKVECGRVDRSYHDFRDSKLEAYERAICWLLDSGMQVVRLGKVVRTRSQIKRAGFFDYGFSEKKDDRLELGIVQSLSFIFGSASGPTDVAITLGIPFLATDLAPPHCVPLGKMDMYLPKKLESIESGELVPYFSIIDQVEGIFNGHTWEEKYGIKFIDNTSFEIMQAVQDMVGNLERRNFLNEEEKVEWDRYLAEYWVKNEYSRVATLIAPSFLKKNSKLFFQV